MRLLTEYLKFSKVGVNRKGALIMGKDILFKTDDFVFSYRVAGILIYDNKILLQKPLNDDGYSLIGGHVLVGETTDISLIREFKEEIGADISIDRLFAVGEIFFPWGKRPCHQISLYYNIKLRDTALIPVDGIFNGIDCLENKKFSIDFCWVPLDEIKNIKLYPEELVSYILEDKKEIIHFVSKQI